MLAKAIVVSTHARMLLLHCVDIASLYIHPVALLCVSVLCSMRMLLNYVGVHNKFLTAVQTRKLRYQGAGVKK